MASFIVKWYLDKDYNRFFFDIVFGICCKFQRKNEKIDNHFIRKRKLYFVQMVLWYRWNA